MTGLLPIDVLENHAAAERKQLHNHITGLRETVRRRLEPKKLLRQYLFPAGILVALAGLALGYGLTGIFRRD